MTPPKEINERMIPIEMAMCLYCQIAKKKRRRYVKKSATAILACIIFLFNLRKNYVTKNDSLSSSIFCAFYDPSNQISFLNQL